MCGSRISTATWPAVAGAGLPIDGGVLLGAVAALFYGVKKLVSHKSR